MPHPSLQGLYLLLDPVVCPSRRLVDVLKEAADHGVRLFQYRDKQASMRDAYHIGTALRRAAGDAGALFIVNDRCDLALAIEADGAHVGQTDLPLAEARLLLGQHRLLGISTHTAEQVAAAAEQCPDYIAYGPVFDTATKPDHEAVVGIESLRAIRERISVPLFAIGGIAAVHVGAILDAGADGVAVCSGVLQAPDIGAAVDAFMARFRQ
ncbi:MAG TPA: thiamine phosphate synthase [Nitrospiraceae bacterium]|nr:thiamine phosphate synthase [Nitrospiraceae bacterium]